MRVLITNTSLATRGGTETFVRQLARGLQTRGHSVMAYSSDLSQGERMLEQDVIPVATDIENLTSLPDVIHGQHHLDAMTALNALSGVPAVYHCHGAVWRGFCPRHPRIHRYITVSRTLKERIAIESNIEPSRIDVVLNGVDLLRFAKVREARPQALRALFYNSRHERHSATVTAVRDAAQRAGLELELLGFHFGNHTDEPHLVLPDYDIVFASGLSALEAMASGCAVIVLGRTSCGEMVGPDNFDRYREVNFSIATNSDPPSAVAIEAELLTYSAQRTVEVTRRVRREAGFESVVDRLLAAYDEVIEENRRTKRDLDAEIRANHLYLRKIVPLIKATDIHLGKRWSSAATAASTEAAASRIDGVDSDIEPIELNSPRRTQNP
jgi:glycosyltransferase involved in cell wall biosynthesis